MFNLKLICTCENFFKKLKLHLPKRLVQSAFWKTHSYKLIPNWTRNCMITYANCILSTCICLSIHVHVDHLPALFWTSSSKALGCMDFVLLRRPTISGVTACSGSTTGKRSSDTCFPLCRQLSTQSTDTRWIPFFIAFSRVVFLPSLKICLNIIIKIITLHNYNWFVQETFFSGDIIKENLSFFWVATI